MRFVWVTEVGLLDSQIEYSDFWSAIEPPTDEKFGYHELGYCETAYLLKVEKEGPFARGSIVAAWHSSGDWAVKKLPYYLRQQTQLLDAVNRKFERLTQDKRWPERIGKVFTSFPPEDCDLEYLFRDLPEVAVANGVPKNEATFIDQLYQSRNTDPSLLGGINEQVFISHNHADREFVRQLGRDLADTGIRVWIDEAEIKFGESLIWKIATALTKVDYVLAVISINSISSNWVQKELEIAISQEITQGRFKVIPLLLDNCDIPAFLCEKLYADFRNSAEYPQILRKLVYSIQPAAMLVDKIKEMIPDAEVNATIRVPMRPPDSESDE
jgi:hypothetical protein